MRLRPLIAFAALGSALAAAACLTTSGLTGGTRDESEAGTCADCGAAACSGGTADCNGQTADGCESTLATDPHNCGVCGHDCLGGACTDSVCAGITIQTVPGRPTGIAVDDAAVYYGINPPGASVSEIVRIDKDGANAKPLALGLANVEQVALDDAFVYWVEASTPTGRILRLPKDGSTSTPQTVATGLGVDARAELTIVAPDLVFSAYGQSDGGGVPGGVYRCALTGCGSKPTTLYKKDSVVGANADSAFFTFGLEQSPGPGVLTCPAAGCADAGPTLVAGTTEAAVQVVASSAGTFFTTATGIFQIPSGGGAIALVASGLTALGPVVADADHVYFASTTGTVYGCPARAGCTSPTLYATGLTGIEYLAQDASSLFVTSGSAATGAVTRIAK